MWCWGAAHWWLPGWLPGPLLLKQPLLPLQQLALLLLQQPHLLHMAVHGEVAVGLHALVDVAQGVGEVCRRGAKHTAHPTQATCASTHKEAWKAHGWKRRHARRIDAGRQGCMQWVGPQLAQRIKLATEPIAPTAHFKPILGVQVNILIIILLPVCVLL